VQVYFSNRFPKYLEDFTYSAMDFLGVSNLRGEVRIRMVRRLEDDCYGSCLGNDREVDVQIATTMMGEPISRTNKLLTVGHELVHVRQCLMRQLYIDAKGATVWNGADYSYCEKSVERSRGLPWETEAFALQQSVLDNWYRYKKTEDPRRINI